MKKKIIILIILLNIILTIYCLVKIENIKKNMDKQSSSKEDSSQQISTQEDSSQQISTQEDSSQQNNNETSVLENILVEEISNFDSSRNKIVSPNFIIMLFSNKFFF